MVLTGSPKCKGCLNFFYFHILSVVWNLGLEAQHQCFFFQICDLSGLVTIQNSPLAKFGYINKVKKSRTPATW
jgi:hypothetical protein